MPKDVPFKVYDLRRKNPHNLTVPPAKIRHLQLDPGEWTRASESKAAGGCKSGRVERPRRRVSKKATAAKLPKKAIDVLKSVAAWVTTCQHCNRFGDDPDVSSPAPPT